MGWPDCTPKRRDVQKTFMRGQGYVLKDNMV